MAKASTPRRAEQNHNGFNPLPLFPDGHEEKLGGSAINWIGLTMVVIALAAVAWLNASSKPAAA